MVKNIKHKWKIYRYRFVPWIALNLKNRSARTVSDHSCDKLLPDTHVGDYLCTFFTALLEGFTGTAQSSSRSTSADLHSYITENDLETHVCHNDLPIHTSDSTRRFVSKLWKSASGASLESLHRKNLVIMRSVLGFTVEKRPSLIAGAGQGVIVTGGHIPEGTVVAVYPGLMYNPWEPILLQSIGNQFVFRCIDNIHIDGNDRALSRFLYRSCAHRDRVGPYWLCDTSWLTDWPVNPLAVGQYVNNHTKERPANVAYQEIDITEEFPFRLRCYIPNTRYGSSLDDNTANTSTRCVVLVSLTKIEEGEELLSSYFTLVQRDDGAT